MSFALKQIPDGFYYALTPFTMIDYPDKTACVVWFSGCNMRCQYCHNPELVRRQKGKPLAEVLEFLHKRKGLLDGVVLSGGEATCSKPLMEFARAVKDMGFDVKLDSNGLNPKKLGAMLKEDLIDYVALDYKAPPDKFSFVTGTDKFERFSQSLDLLCGQKSVPFEVRTTVHTALLDEVDVNAIIGDLVLRGYKGTYYIQNFIANPEKPTLGGFFEQKRMLDLARINEPAQFSIGLRNF